MDSETQRTEVRRYQFNVDQYYKMAEVGILPWGHGEELIEGVVWDRSPLVRNRSHPALKGSATRFLNAAAGLPEEFDARIHKYTAEEYHVMGETAILTGDDRVELIDGEIVLMPPMLSPHASTVSRINRLFNELIMREQVVVWVQCPISFPGDAEPDPDLALLQPRPDFYRPSLPTPRDALLLVEISDSTLRYDRNVKLPLYALNGIPEFWLVNLPEETVEVYRHPVGGSYQESTQLRRGDTLSPQAFPDVRLTVGGDAGVGGLGV